MKRDSWRSKWGFILACIGSAVGMGNIWLFPARVSAYGGGTFLVPYIIFVILIASTGVIGEMAFGRATRSGPAGAFGEATRQRFGTAVPGKVLGLIPVLGVTAAVVRQGNLRRSFSSTMLCACTATMLYEIGIFAFGMLFQNTILSRGISFLITGGLSLLSYPILYPIIKAIDKIGDRTWKD